MKTVLVRRSTAGPGRSKDHISRVCNEPLSSLDQRTFSKAPRCSWVSAEV